MSALSTVQLATLSMVQAATQGRLEEAEKVGLALPQVECKVFHHFGPGFCIREMHIPAGVFVMGHAHKQGLANSFVKGRIKLLQNGVWTELTAPLFFVGTPGRKVALALEDSIWQNIIVTDETNTSKIEALFVEKSPEWLALQEKQS